MSNRLNMAEHQAILGLARLNWSYRRIAAELGVDRETVSRHARRAITEPPGAGPPDSNATISITGSGTEADSNAAIVITGSTGLATGGSPGRRSLCEPRRAIIIEGLEQGLTARRIWQDLRDEHEFVGDYQSVQRFVRRLNGRSPLPFRRMECGPGEEAQVDFGKGAPIIASDGKRKTRARGDAQTR